MADIEFLDPASAVPLEPELTAASVAPGTRRLALARVLVPVLWAVAALLAFIAPFHMLYRLSIRTFSFHQSQQADGWGRLSRVDVPFAEHDPRYGVISCVVVGLFLLAAVSAAVPPLRPRYVGHGMLRVRSFPFGLVGCLLAVSGVALLAANVGSALLYVQSITNSINAQLASPVNDQVVLNSPAHASARLDLGGMVWISLAAIGVAIAALVIVAVRARHPAAVPQATPDPQPAIESGDSSDDVLT